MVPLMSVLRPLRELWGEREEEGEGGYEGGT